MPVSRRAGRCPIEGVGVVRHRLDRTKSRPAGDVHDEPVARAIGAQSHALAVAAAVRAWPCRTIRVNTWSRTTSVRARAWRSSTSGDVDALDGQARRVVAPHVRGVEGERRRRRAREERVPAEAERKRLVGAACRASASRSAWSRRPSPRRCIACVASNGHGHAARSVVGVRAMRDRQHRARPASRATTVHARCQPTPWIACGWSPKLRASANVAAGRGAGARRAMRFE